MTGRNEMIQHALAYAAHGWRVVPLYTPSGNPNRPCSCGAGLDEYGQPACSVGKHPRIKSWQNEATSEAATIERWWGMWPDANIGIACGAGTGWFVVDVDGEEGQETLKRLEAANSPLPETVEQITGSGGRHLLFKAEEGLNNAVRFAPGLDIRTDGGQVAVEPSLHGSGAYYQWEAAHHPEDHEIATAPRWLLQAIRKGAGKARGAVGKAPVIAARIKDGQRDDTLLSMAGTMRRRGADQAMIEAALTVMNEQRCDPPLSVSQVKKIAASAVRYEPAENSIYDITNPTGVNGDGNYVVNVVLSSPVSDAGPPEDLEPEAYYGLPGQVVMTIEPHTESSNAALMAAFLTGAGVLIGRGPHLYRDGARHCVNEFACLVGLTASGRKGTASRRISEILSVVDTQHCKYNKIDYMTREAASSLWKRRLVDGLGSGEALVANLAEDDEELDGDHESRRRLVFEEEFSRPLTVMRREGSILSQILRAAWDGAPLASRTKGKVLEVRQAHLGVLGHVTEDELKRNMGSADMFNGFANRFLWFCTKRSKSLPFGGGKVPLAPLISTLRRVLEYASVPREIDFDAEAAALWGAGGIYDRLVERPPGLLGAVTGRAEPHVMRLALFYAVMDAAPSITVKHLLAGLALWDFNERSCAYLFGRSTGDKYADTILEILVEAYPGFLTRTQIRDAFGRNAEPGRIPAALAVLAREGLIVGGGLSQERGRPLEVWSAVEGAQQRRQNDINDKSPLLRARAVLAEKV